MAVRTAWLRSLLAAQSKDSLSAFDVPLTTTYGVQMYSSQLPRRHAGEAGFLIEIH